jgi:hypothetical protein
MITIPFTTARKIVQNSYSPMKRMRCQSTLRMSANETSMRMARIWTLYDITNE